MHSLSEDTIAAIITPPGEGGVAIIRMSGPEALSIADQIFSCKKPRPSERKAYTFVYGYVVEAGEKIDEALLLIWKAPHSFTAEDVVEIQCHGGWVSSRRVLRILLAHGAVSADAGEFSRRAFLNGRIDLMQAEAVMDLVRSQSDRAQAAALQQLDGSLSESINTVYDDLIRIAAQLEATLDFPEDELPETVMPMIRSSLDETHGSVRTLISTWNEGHLLRDGAVVVLSGKPNAGKSTLMNALLKNDRAIVSEHAGTTRDSIEENFLLEGIPLRIVDTAGLRETDCGIEQEGIRRTLKHIEQADLNVHLIDLSQLADEETKDHLLQLDQSPSILVGNKTDLSRKFDHPVPPNVPFIHTCLESGEGVDELLGVIKGRLTQHRSLSSRPHAVISERHHQILQTVSKCLDEVRIQVEGKDADIVVCSGILRDSLHELGKVTGREYHEELLDSIFGQFCIGK